VAGPTMKFFLSHPLLLLLLNDPNRAEIKGASNIQEFKRISL